MTERTHPPERLATVALQGVVTAAWVAIPDYAHTRASRAAAKTLCLAGVVAATVAIERSLRPETRTRLEEQREAEARMAETSERYEAMKSRLSGYLPDGWWPAALAGGSAAAIAAVVGLNAATNRAIRAGADTLGRRGVRRPYTVIGLGLGAVFAATEYATSADA